MPAPMKSGPPPRRFALELAAFGMLILWFLRRGEIINPSIALGTAALLLGAGAVAFANPKSLHGPYQLSRRISEIVGSIMGPIVLTLIFALLITPTGMLLRLFGYDPLRLRHHARGTSYWRKATLPGPLDRMF